MFNRLKKGAIPSQFPWTQPATPTAQKRIERAQKRKRDHESRNMPDIFSPDNYVIGAEIETETSEERTDVKCETTSQSNMDISTQTEIIDVRDNISQTPEIAPFALESFANDNAAIHFYTGLESYIKVCFVLSTLGMAQNNLRYMYGHVANISVKDQFFLVLMKLRRYTSNFELSRMFRISEVTVYNVFCTWIRFMALQWGELDLWPARDIVRYFSPSDFRRKFPTTRAIIDGTEIPIKRPGLPKAQQSTFSTYKNRNTVNILVGCTPGGLISYISPAYGGSTSDRQIIERSKIPKFCDPGDSIMADKGFNVQDIFAPLQRRNKHPCFFQKAKPDQKCNCNIGSQTVEQTCSR